MISFFTHLSSNKKNKKIERIPENLIGVYISCNHMCYTSCYIFSLDKQEDQAWVFSAQCATQSNDFTRIEIDNCCVEDSDLLEFVRDYKSCKKCKFIKIYDETTYCYSFSYSDSTYDSASVEPDKEIIQFFYRLADKYHNKVE